MIPSPGNPSAYARDTPALPRGATPRDLAVALLAVICLLLSPASALADETPGAPGQDELTWSVRPADNEQGTQRANYAYVVEPGQEITDALVVTNASAQELALAVYAADGYTTPSGHLDLQPGDVSAVDVGSWVSTDVDELVLAPGESQEVPFTLRVPVDATPGDHPGGIVTSYVSGDGSGTVRLDRRLGSRIHVRVAGEQTVSMSVSDVTVSQPLAVNPVRPVTSTVRYTLTNTGNVRTLGHESVTVAGPAGLGAASGKLSLDEVMPGDSLTREVVVEGTWPLGRLSAEVVVTPEAVAGQMAPQVQASATTWAIPWVLLGLLALLVVLAAWLGVRRGRRPGSISARAATAAPQTPGEAATQPEGTSSGTAAHR